MRSFALSRGLAIEIERHQKIAVEVQMRHKANTPAECTNPCTTPAKSSAHSRDQTTRMQADYTGWRLRKRESMDQMAFRSSMQGRRLRRRLGRRGITLGLVKFFERGPMKEERKDVE